MNSMRKIVGFFFAIAIAVFALPANSDSLTTKTFNADFPTILATGAAVQIPVNFHNTTPGVSTINSIQIFAPPGGTVSFVAPYLAPGSPGTVQQVGPNGSWLIINNFPGIKSQKSLPFTFIASVTVSSCTHESWPKPNANAGNSLNGDVFQWNGTDSQLVSGAGCDGILACQGTGGTYTFTEGFVNGSRGPYNKDGSPCNPALYDAFADAANQKAALFIDPIQPQAITHAVITWPARFVDPTTGQLPITQLAWQLKPDNTPDYHDGRYCVSPNFPAPYGTLAAAIPSANPGDQNVITTTLPVVFLTTPSSTAPIPVVVDSERMNVIGQSGTALTVIRGQGGTAPVAHALNYPNTSTAKSVMSTPFPLDGNSNVMLVCIVSETAETQTAEQCTPPTPGLACVQKTTEILGDWISSDD